MNGGGKKIIIIKTYCITSHYIKSIYILYFYKYVHAEGNMSAIDKENVRVADRKKMCQKEFL